MTITSVAQWSTDQAQNTDIAGNNIDEGCSPAGINNAIRYMMAQIAATPLAETAATMRTNLGLVAERQAKKAARLRLILALAHLSHWRQIHGAMWFMTGRLTIWLDMEHCDGKNVQRRSQTA